MQIPHKGHRAALQTRPWAQRAKPAGAEGAAKHPALIAGALLHPKLGWAPGWRSGQPPALPTAPGHPQQQDQLHPHGVGRSPGLVPRVCLPRVPSTAWLGLCPAHSVPKSHAATAQSHQQMGKGLFCSPRCDTVTPVPAHPAQPHPTLLALVSPLSHPKQTARGTGQELCDRSPGCPVQPQEQLCVGSRTLPALLKITAGLIASGQLKT